MLDLEQRVGWQVLVVRCQIGDRAAFEEIIAFCQPRLRAFLFRMLSGVDAQQVEDVAQDVWVDVYRAVPRLADPAAFVPWLYRIARNRAYRALRSRAAPTASIDDNTERVPAADEGEGSDEPQFTPEDAAAVHAALDRLAPPRREVLLLRFMQDLSYEQIARVVGCPVGTVRSRIHLAKRELREILRKAGHSS
jgi:RNA polymerase sigma-70 factor (ECF subfamily)